MRRTGFVLVLLAAVSVLGALVGAPPARSQGPGPGGPGGPPRGPGGQVMGIVTVDSFAMERDSLVRLVLERIKGRENAPAESVFRNIKVMKGRTAEQVLRSMDAFGRFLGVPCSHCHVENHWADDDKWPKKTARDMMMMTATINDSLLAHVSFKQGDRPSRVGCLTCHRGHPNPNWGMQRRGPRGEGGPGGPGRPGGEGH